MPSNITGNHDLTLEIADSIIETVLAKAIVGIHQLGVATLRITKITVRSEDGGVDRARFHIVAEVRQGRVQIAGFDARITEGFLRLLVTVVMKAGLQDNPAAAVFAADEEEWHIHYEWSSDQARQAFWSGFAATPSHDNEALLFSAVVGPLRAKMASQANIVIPLHELEFGYGSIQRLEIRSFSGAASGVTLGVTLSHHRALGASLAHKTRIALEPSHGLALTLSPEFIHEAVVCRMIANMVGVSHPSQLCATCGLAGAVSLKSKWPDIPVSHLDLTSIGTQCVAGAVRVGLGLFSAMHVDLGPFGSLRAVSGRASGTFDIRSSITGSDLALAAQLVAVPVAVSFPWWVHVFLPFIAGQAERALAHIIEVLIKTEVENLDLAQTVPLPRTFGDWNVLYRRALVDGDGMTVLANAYVAWERPSPNLTLSEHREVLRREEVERGSDGRTCIRAGYDYGVFEVDEKLTMEAVTSDLASPVEFRWFIENNEVGRDGVFGTTVEGERTVELQVSCSPDRRKLTAQTQASDGNYSLTVRCRADDGLGEYEVFERVEVRGRSKEYDDSEYTDDQLQCAVPPNAMLLGTWKTPVSDPPDWGKLASSIRDLVRDFSRRSQASERLFERMGSTVHEQTRSVVRLGAGLWNVRSTKR
jgi:hypothetical protein